MPARELAEVGGVPAEVKRVNTLLAACHRLDGDYELALRTVPEATTPPEPWCGRALPELGRIRLALGDREAARECAARAVEISRAAEYHVDEQWALELLAAAT